MRERNFTDEPIGNAGLDDDETANPDVVRSVGAREGKLQQRKAVERFPVIRGMYEVADTWEMFYLLAVPVVCLMVFYQAELGVPMHLRGLLFLAAAVYLGSCFLFLVVIDRRYAQRQHRRSRGAQAAAMDALNETRIARQAQAEARRNRRQHDLVAQQRGAERAGSSVANSVAGAEDGTTEASAAESATGPVARASPSAAKR